MKWILSWLLKNTFKMQLSYSRLLAVFSGKCIPYLHKKKKQHVRTLMTILNV